MSNAARIAILVGLGVVIGGIWASKQSRDARECPAPAPLATTQPVGTVQTQPATGAKLPRMVDLGAKSCIPCKQMAPILEQLRGEYAGRAVVEFIDVFENPKAGREYGIRIMPTQIFFDKQGREFWRHEGFLSKDEIVAKLREGGLG